MIADGSHVRALGGLPATITDEILLPFFGPASRRLAGWVGQEAYADGEDPSPTDPDRAAALKDGEAYLALFYVAPRINMVIADSGIVSYQTNSTTNDNITYLTPKQLRELREVWLQDAVSACEGYIIKAGVAMGQATAADDPGDGQA